MVPFRYQMARQRLETGLMRLSNASSAKHLVPFAVANLVKWRELIDGKRTDFRPHLPTEQDMACLPEPKISVSQAYLLGKIIQRSFYQAWWTHIAPRCASNEQAKQAWKYCSAHLYQLFSTVTRGGSEQAVRQLVATLENCLET